MNTDRRYTDEEIQRILKEAAEHQQQSDIEYPDVGLTLAEIERIAQEAGIDPIHIRLAATHVDGRPQDHIETSRFWGGHTKIELERTIEGEVPAEKLDVLLVPIIREVLGQSGQFERLGSTLTWRDMNLHSGLTHVSVAVAQGKTHIRIETPTLRTTLFLFHLGTFIASLIAFMSLISPKDLPAMLTFGSIASAIILFFGGRFAYDLWSNKFEQKLEKLAGTLASAVAEATQPALVESTSETAPILQLDEEPAPIKEATPSRNRRRTT